MRVVFIGLMLALATPTLAAERARQVVRTSVHTFEADRLVLRSGRRSLVDLRELAAAVGRPGAFSIRILSAAGPVASVLVRSRTCNDDTCHDREQVEAWRGSGGEAPLADLLADGSLLAALRGSRELRGMLEAPGNRAVAARFARARTWREAAEALTFGDLRTRSGVVGLPSNRVDCYAVEGYDEARNALSVRLYLEARGNSRSSRGQGLPLVVTPSRAFAESLARDRREGLGLFARPR